MVLATYPTHSLVSMEHKLLIEPTFKTGLIAKLLRRAPFKRPIFPIQGSPFDFNLRITNIGDSSFPGTDIKRIAISGAGQASISHNINKTYSIPSLNPSAYAEINIDRMTTLLEGIVWISCQITPLDPKDKITTYQKDIGTQQLVEPSTNSWGQEVLVLSKNQLSFSHQNTLLVILTILIFLDGVWGLGNIASASLNFVGNILSSIGSSLQGQPR